MDFDANQGNYGLIKEENFIVTICTNGNQPNYRSIKEKNIIITFGKNDKIIIFLCTQHIMKVSQ